MDSKVQDQKIISSLVELTRQRDQIAIRNKLLTSLIEITDAAWLVFCRMQTQDNKDILEVRGRIPNPSSDKAEKHFPRELFDRVGLFEKSLKTGSPVWVQDLEDYEAIIFCLPGDDVYRDFVVLFDRVVHGRSERMVVSILNLYDNFLSLVIENTRDSLTHLLNRGAFDSDLPALLVKMNERHERRTVARPGQKRKYLAMIDLDFFKRINDTYGHLYGDEVLLIFASLLRENLEENAQLYRYGGEEFAAIIDSISHEGMKSLMEELRLAIERYSFPQVGQVTVSIGVAELKPNSLPSNLIDVADRALYHSKTEGRNRVTFYQDIQQQEKADRLQQDEEVFF